MFPERGWQNQDQPQLGMLLRRRQQSRRQYTEPVEGVISGVAPDLATADGAGADAVDETLGPQATATAKLEPICSLPARSILADAESHEESSEEAARRSSSCGKSN